MTLDKLLGRLVNFAAARPATPELHPAVSQLPVHSLLYALLQRTLSDAEWEQLQESKDYDPIDLLETPDRELAETLETREAIEKLLPLEHDLPQSILNDYLITQSMLPVASPRSLKEYRGGRSLPLMPNLGLRPTDLQALQLLSARYPRLAADTDWGYMSKEDTQRQSDIAYFSTGILGQPYIRLNPQNIDTWLNAPELPQWSRDLIEALSVMEHELTHRAQHRLTAEDISNVGGETPAYAAERLLLSGLGYPTSKLDAIFPP